MPRRRRRMHISQLDTPALVVDLDILERNLHRMANYTKSIGVALRPHIKTHKVPEIARMQVAGGAVGITARQARRGPACHGRGRTAGHLHRLPDPLPA